MRPCGSCRSGCQPPPGLPSGGLGVGLEVRIVESDTALNFKSNAPGGWIGMGTGGPFLFSCAGPPGWARGGLDLFPIPSGCNGHGPAFFVPVVLFAFWGPERI